MKFATTAAIAACFAHVNALRVHQAETERAQLWEVCGGPGVQERQCVTELTCSGYSDETEMKICKYAQKGEKCGDATGAQQVMCEPNTRLQCVATTNSEGVCTKEKPSDLAWDTAGHFAKGDFLEDSRTVDPEEYYGFVEKHLYRLSDGAWTNLVNKFKENGDDRTKNEDDVADLISESMAGLMRQYKETIDTEIEKIQAAREAARNAEESFKAGAQEEISWVIQELIDGPDSGDDTDPEEEIHRYVADVVQGLEDYSHFESVQAGAARAVAQKIAAMDKELLTKLVGDQIASNPDTNEIAAVLTKKLSGFDFDEARSVDPETVIANLKQYLYAIDGY